MKAGALITVGLFMLPSFFTSTKAPDLVTPVK